MDIKKSLQTAGILSLIIILTKLLGFAKSIFIAAYFGAGNMTDGFFLAILAPEFMAFLMEVSLPIVTIPVLVDYISQKKFDEAWRIISTLVNFALLFSLFLVAAGEICVRPFFSIFLSMDDSQAFAEIIKITRIILPTIVPVGVFGIMLGALNALKKFVWPATTQLVNNLIIIGGIVLLGHKLGIYGLVAGVFCGAIIKLCLLLPSLGRDNFKYSLVLHLRHPGVKKMWKLLPPILGVALASRANYLFGRLLSAGLEDGSVSFLTYSIQLTQMPLAFFVVTLSTVLLPKFSYDIVQGETSEVKNTLHKSIKVLFLILIPCQLFLIFYSVPLVQLFFQRGVFPDTATQPTAYAVLWYSAGLFTWAVIEPIKRAYYAREETWMPSIIGIASVILNLTLCLFLIHTSLKHAGIALATSIANCFYMFVLTFIYKRQTQGIEILNLVSYLLRVAIAGFASIALSKWLTGYIGIVSPFILLSMATVIFIPTYLAILKILQLLTVLFHQRIQIK
jgi:putative peptidoglycan lipid II flippase